MFNFPSKEQRLANRLLKSYYNLKRTEKEFRLYKSLLLAYNGRSFTTKYGTVTVQELKKANIDTAKLKRVVSKDELISCVNIKVPALMKLLGKERFNSVVNEWVSTRNLIIKLKEDK